MISLAYASPTPLPSMFNLPSSLSASPGVPFSASTSTPIRKRRAASPPALPINASAGPSRPHRNTSPTPAKRRRPNLAHGFSGLSLATQTDHGEAGSSLLPTYAESQLADQLRRRVDDDDNDDDDLFATRELRVEETDPASPPAGRPTHSRRHRNGNLSSGSISPDSGSGSDHFTLPKLRRRSTQQADEVEQPVEDSSQESEEHRTSWQDISVEDITPSLIGVKRRSSSRSDGAQGGGKRRREGMDVDDEMGEYVEEIRRDADSTRGRARTRWHEPEKDRIIYTSLGSSSSRSRSRSTSPSSPTHLSQPGSNGFTISPSMLTRLLAAQKGNDTSLPPAFTFPPAPPQHEMGLILYRPLGIAPGVDRDIRGIVEEWQGSLPSGNGGAAEVEGGRFEMVDDDEDLRLEETISEEPRLAGDMDIDM